MAQLGKLNNLFKDPSLEDTVVLAVTVDRKEDLEKIAPKISDDGSHPGIMLLSDPGHAVINRYGIFNPDGNGLPHPATYVIDKKGIVRWKFLETNYRIRPTNEQVLEALKDIQQR